jgi:hypothetical protein
MNFVLYATEKEFHLLIKFLYLSSMKTWIEGNSHPTQGEYLSDFC